MSEVGNIIEALIIGRALELGASDIHVEPRGAKIAVRMRVDGILHETDSFPASKYGEILDEVKTLAGMNPRENLVPQHGTFRVTIARKKYVFRVDTLPTNDGEKIVLHFSQLNAAPPTLKQLGFWGENLSRLSEILRLKRGLILLAGPDDAGKSTTLFAILSILANDRVNISTIETTIEHKIPGANQIAVNPRVGLTTATGLASLVRSDSEIIMASRIPDAVSAKYLVDYALSGHLVFSTLNAKSGGAAIDQLARMNIEPYLIAHTLRNVISTRLVRQLCPKCRENYKPTKAEIENIMSAFHLTKSSLKQLAAHEKQMANEGFGVKSKTMSISGGTISRLWRAKGCKSCLNTGYTGRIGLYEIAVNSPMIERLTLGRADAKTIDQILARDDMMNLRADGLIKALRGVTSIDEVLAKTEESCY